MTMVVDVHAAAITSPAAGPLSCVAPDILAEGAFFRRHPTLIGHDGLHQTCGFVESCMHENDPVSRLTHLFSETYAQLTTPLVPIESLQLHLALPRWVNEVPDFKERFERNVQSLDLSKISKIFPYYGGATAGIQAYRGARNALSSAQVDTVLVGGLDTMVTPTILDARALAGLANTKSNSYGAIPSEAGAIQLVQRQNSQTIPPISRILSMTTGQEQESLTDPERGIVGSALKKCVAEAMDEAPTTHLGTWLSDYNGDRHRAEELGFVIANLGQSQLLEPICPASSIGDVGAATVAVYACLVPWVKSEETEGVLVTAGDPQGERGAIVCQSIT